MNLLDIYIRTYDKLRNRTWLPYWIFTPFRRTVRILANLILPIYLDKKKVSRDLTKSDVIVSFTSFPARIDNVWQVVECMLRQTYQPSKIYLWLSLEQFPTYESIPQSLRERENDIFKIRLVEGDIRSHKKYYYVAKEFPDSMVFLIDDDIYYPTDIIERSIKMRRKKEGAVICNYGYHMAYNEDKSLAGYSDWVLENMQSESNDLFFGSGGGTLLVPSELYSDLTNIELAQKLCPIADDIWLNAMVSLSNLKIILLRNGLILGIQNRNNIALSSQNIEMHKNDEQLQNVTQYYKNVTNSNLWNS